MKSGNRRQFVRHEWWVRFVIGIAVRSVITWRHLKLWLSLKTNLTLIAVGIFCSFCTKLFSFFVLVYENPVGSQFGVRQAKNCFRYHGRHKIYAGGIWKLTGVSLWKRIKCFPSTLRQMIHFCLVSTWNDGLRGSHTAVRPRSQGLFLEVERGPWEQDLGFQLFGTESEVKKREALCPSLIFPSFSCASWGAHKPTERLDENPRQGNLDSLGNDFLLCKNVQKIIFHVMSSKLKSHQFLSSSGILRRAKIYGC